MQNENLLRFAVGQDLGGVVVDLDQVRCKTVGAIDIIDQMRELVVSDRPLIILEHVPFGLTPENTQGVGRPGRAIEDR